MKFLKGIKVCQKVIRVRKQGYEMNLNIFNTKKRMKENKQKWKEYVEHISDERLPQQALKYKARRRRNIKKAKKEMARYLKQKRQIPNP